MSGKSMIRLAFPTGAIKVSSFQTPSGYYEKLVERQTPQRNSVLEQRVPCVYFCIQFSILLWFHSFISSFRVNLLVLGRGRYADFT